jgi:hypothetical protein
MRLLSFIPAFSIFIIPASAQMSSEHLERFAQSLLAKQGGTTPACAAAAGRERLTDMRSNDLYKGTDAVYYSYLTNERGSRFDFAYMTYPQFYESDNPVFYPFTIAMVSIKANSAEFTHTDPEGYGRYYQLQSFSYNTAGNVTANNMYYYKAGYFDNDDELIAADSDRYVYNQAGILTDHQGMDLDDKKWQKTTRSGYEYDTHGRLVTDTVFYYVRGGGWEPARVVRYRYATGEILASAQSQVLMNDEWIQGERYDMEYYPDYRLKAISIQSVLTLRDSFVYTSSGTVKARYRFRAVPGVTGQRWQLAQAYINVLDKKGAIVNAVELVPAEAGRLGARLDTARITTYTYTTYGNPEERIVYEKQGMIRLNFTEYSYETFGDSDPEYRPSNSDYYYYRSAYETPGADAKLYPNPASNVVYIELPDDYYTASLTVYDAVGGTIIAGAFAGGERMWLNVASLANGMYYYKVVADKNTTATGKFVVQR